MTLSVKLVEQRGGVLVAESETHLLFEFPEKASNGWRSFYLRLIDLPRRGNRTRKRAWWLGHNGDRFAWTKDAEKLFDRDPDTHRWVEEEIRESGEQAPHHTIDQAVLETVPQPTQGTI